MFEGREKWNFILIRQQNLEIILNRVIVRTKTPELKGINE